MAGGAFIPAVDLTALVHDGHATASEVVEAAIRRIEDASELNAFVEVDGERAVAAAARAPVGRLTGLPVVIKANTAAAGWCTDHGSQLLAGHRADHSAFLVRRLEMAGAVVVGTTRLPEFGILPTTEPRHGGPVVNPWDPGRTPGGSSGGSAAAVAAGLVPLAHGNDGGGSIRVPAACCGLVGLKPTRGRISRGPDAGDAFLTVDGVLTRTVADTALGLDVLFGYEVGDATWAPRPNEPLSYAMRRDPGRLRIAVSAANVLDSPVDPAAVRAVRDMAEELASLGHHVAEADPALPGPEAVGLFIGVFAAARGADIAAAIAAAGREPGEEEIEPLSRALHQMATSATAVDYLRTVRELQRLARAVVAFFADWDVLMTPALAGRPLPVGACHGAMEDPLAALGVAEGFAPYSALFNVTGQPAMSLPTGFGTDGLPTAVQLVGPPLGEETLLQLAAQLEAARPWHDRTPPTPLAPRPTAVA